MRSWKLSAFADEICDDLNKQITILKDCEIQFIEFRSAYGRNVLQYTKEQTHDAMAIMKGEGIGVSAVGSPIGKQDITAPFLPQCEDLKHIMDIAHIMETPYIRIFSFFIPEDQDAGLYTHKVIDQLGEFTRLAEREDLILLHENEKAIYGDTPQRCYTLLNAIANPHLRATYDFSNFVQCGVKHYPDGWLQLKPFVQYIHLKDSVYSPQQAVRDMGGEVTGNVHRPVGQGDGNCEIILQELEEEGFTGFYSIEPHLGAEYGDTGEKRFHVAVDAVNQLLSEITRHE